VATSGLFRKVPAFQAGALAMAAAMDVHAWARSRSRAVELKMNAKAGSTAPRRDSKLVGPVPQPRSDGGRPRVHERGETAGAGRRGSSSASNRREEERERERARADAGQDCRFDPCTDTAFGWTTSLPRLHSV
jgi:hypothetical protein